MMHLVAYYLPDDQQDQEEELFTKPSELALKEHTAGFEVIDKRMNRGFDAVTQKTLVQIIWETKDA